eukprot:scaffold870_cov268-Pinguiococcus_pyrenoidosus.AAC.76
MKAQAEYSVLPSPRNLAAASRGWDKTSERFSPSTTRRTSTSKLRTPALSRARRVSLQFSPKS